MDNEVVIEEQDILVDNKRNGEDIALQRSPSSPCNAKKPKPQDIFQYSSQVTTYSYILFFFYLYFVSFTEEKVV